MTATIETMISRLSGWLARHSIDVLRVSLGLVFVAFGTLKFFPGVSPAEALSVATLEKLSLGMLSGYAAQAVIAAMEVFIGLALVTGKLLKTGLVVMTGALAGFFAPYVFFFTNLFPGAPTLEAQYIFKDIVLAAAAMVIGARALGARLVPARDRMA
ncbi:putative membrane protein YphA (DoxX/SURF4 family) [Nonomuraea thailandensis]|uniref:Membrane protein YphA (DoxX/SURF4 family) n=1 Tax=Nonomuraea thailandensis TaxID=1188745 RepID=A0A9X2GB21_9ACTN|nr:DoxX family protein [Nonomuraea thailandensis]MCP2355686.1 putative membrane protein YphA (DoxX/SURF4 family) [Nonomuraea thailandensis]